MLKRRPSAHLHNSLTSKKFCAERMQRQGNSQKKSSSQGEDFFANYLFFTSCLLVHKLCLFFTSYLATHKLFLTLQAVCRHTIVSIFCKLLSDTQLLLFTSCLFSSNCSNFTSRLPVQIIASIFQNLLVAQLP